MNSSKLLHLLEQKYELSQAQIDFYRKNKFIKIKKVLTPEIIDHFNQIISNKVNELSKDIAPLEKRNTYGKAFLQLMNLWTQNDEIKSFVFSKRLASIASQLMECDGVRLYHDQALFKEANGGYTPWHADQYYWPVGTEKTVTAWIPLQNTPLEMGPLEFSAGSHKVAEGRDLEISEESEINIQKRLRVTDFEHVVEAFDIGELSFHSGWIFHRAGPNITNQTRKVMTIIYLDREMRLKNPENQGQINDMNTWCPGVKIGNVIDSDLNPVLF